MRLQVSQNGAYASPLGSSASLFLKKVLLNFLSALPQAHDFGVIHLPLLYSTPNVINESCQFHYVLWIPPLHQVSRVTIKTSLGHSWIEFNKHLLSVCYVSGTVVSVGLWH